MKQSIYSALVLAIVVGLICVFSSNAKATSTEDNSKPYDEVIHYKYEKHDWLKFVKYSNHGVETWGGHDPNCKECINIYD